MVQYYTGQDTSLMTDEQLAIKVGQIQQIRQMEQEATISDKLKQFLAQ
jgi:hypothetical protein